MITCPTLRSNAARSPRESEELLGRIRYAAARNRWQPPQPRADFPVIDGFHVTRFIAEGGMGRVYEARQLRPSRPVAIKLLRGGHDSSERRLRLFHREADALARLNHPGIASIYCAGLSSAGEPFLAMEFVHGVTLEQHAAHHTLTPGDALRLVARICRALHHAHERQVIHRDLKPSNIMVDDLADPKLLDFGLARITASEQSHLARVTLDGRIAGTLAYMSPEQASARAGAIDPRTDVYSIGVVLYELLTGALPVRVDGRAVTQAIDAIRTEEPTPLRATRADIHPDVERIVLRALRKRPDDRYPSALALAEVIERHLAGAPIAKMRARPCPRRRRRHSFAAAAISVVLGAGALGTDAVPIAETSPSAASVATTAVVHPLGPTITLLGDLSGLERTFRARLHFLQTAPNAVGLDRRGTLVRLALVLERQRRHAEAEECFRMALSDGRPGLQRRLLTTIGLARCIGAQGRHDEANTLFGECHRMVGRLGPHEDAVRIELLVSVAKDRLAQGRLADARRFLDRAAAQRDTGPLTAQWSRWNLANANADFFAATGDEPTEQHWRLQAAAPFAPEHRGTPPRQVPPSARISQCPRSPSVVNPSPTSFIKERSAPPRTAGPAPT